MNLIRIEPAWRFERRILGCRECGKSDSYTTERLNERGAVAALAFQAPAKEHTCEGSFGTSHSGRGIR